MKNLATALETVRDELLAGETVEAAIRLAATEQGLGIELVRNRATAAFGDLHTVALRAARAETAALEIATLREGYVAAQDANERRVLREFFIEGPLLARTLAAFARGAR